MPGLLAILPFLLAGQPAMEDLQALDSRIAEASGGAAARLDQRLRFVRCPVPPDIQPSAQTGFDIYCPALGWRLRVPAESRPTGFAGVAPMLVQRGEYVQVAIVGPRFTIQYQAVATESGRIGDRVRIKLAGGNRVVVAVVSGPGKVQISD